MHGIFNGTLKPLTEINIAPNDLGLARGYAVFDFFRVNKNYPVFIEDHLSRLIRSAEHVKLPVMWSKKELKSLILEMIELNNLSESGVKVIVTGGYSPDGFSSVTPNLIITQHEIKRPEKTYYENGVRLITKEYLRDSASAKTTNYAMALQFQEELQKKGGFDILYRYNGKLLETTRSNFFLVKGSKIITPDEDVLHGITRDKILDFAPCHFDIEIRDIKTRELESADETFICSTIKRVLPVIQIDEKKIGDGKPGNVTNKIMHLFDLYESSYLDYHIKQKSNKSVEI